MISARTASRVRLKTPDEIAKMAVCGQAVGQTLQQLKAMAAPGVNLLEIEAEARRILDGFGAIPSLLNYHPSFSRVPYLHATCLSVNDEVIHGVPHDYKLKEGDVLGIDLCAHIDGWHTDSALTVGIGQVSPRAAKLLKVTEESLYLAVEKCWPGSTLGDVGSTVQRHVQRAGFDVLRSMTGHGVGTAVHEAGLDVANYGRPGAGVRLATGMTFCVEPMVAIGRGDIKHRPGDPWSVVTRDGSLGAHFEHTVAVTEKGPVMLTKVD